MKTPKEIVREGYDRLSSDYRKHFEAAKDEHYDAWLNEFLRFVPLGGRILELGCADGLPVAQRLAQSYDYRGVDISPVQIEQARRQVPSGQFEVADMTELVVKPASLQGIIALYSLIHVPLDQQPSLLRAMHQWLKPGGYALCTVGVSEWTGTEQDWIIPGTTMYWSHTDRATYEQWFTDAGFFVVSSQFVPEGTGGHVLLLVRKNHS